MPISYQAYIIAELTKIATKCESHNPDSKSNVGRQLGIAFLWDTIQDYAKKQSDVAWSNLEKEKLIEAKDLPVGESVLARSPSFTVTCRVSNPVKRFNDAELAKLFKAKYRVPEHTTKEFVEASKLPGNSTKTLKIVETA